MKKILISIAFLIIAQSFMRADEGMWIPMLLKQQNQKDMRANGMRISADDIYDINNASLKDAIVLFGGGCTGEIISDKGLMLTNHHCGYGNIQQHSSLEFNYLEKGFWAMSLDEELPNKGLTATILIRMEDVTKAVLEGVTNQTSESERAKIVEKNIETITNEAVKGTHYSAVIKPFYYGNQYFMYVNEIFKDIRLVGAPPSNIGKFGGDTDNWMWPRHTGDFSVFRIYTGPDGKPAEFAKDNIPYKPKKHLTISTKGYKKDDFTFVFGYPGTTEQFLTSQAVALKTVYENPIAIQLREERLNIIKKHMESDPLIRIQYAAKVASIANGWKKWIGENRGIKRLNTIAEKQVLETKFNTWANATPERKAEYGNLMADFKKVYDKATPYYVSYKYFSEAAYSIEAVRFALSFRSLVYLVEKKETTESAAKTTAEGLINATKSHFKGYQQVIDKESFAVATKIYFEKHDPQYQPQVLKDIAK
ncbi:MAG: S46 family peptidase, partial [Bacteroidales bacterium]|nr:S46 family peptidase [Bacteroidales bacterium]